MAITYVTLPIEYFPDPTKGKPVYNGSVYVGQPNLDPEIEANRISVTLRQQDGNEVVIPPEAQPLTTGAGGVILYEGAAVTVLAEGNYSIKVLDKFGAQVYYVEDAFDGEPVTGDQVALVFDTVADITASTILNIGNLARTKGYYAPGDGGQATYLVAAAQAVDGFGDHLLANGNVALLQSEGSVNVKQYGAAGDGVADDTAAIQAAITTGRGVFIPDGDYLISAALTQTSGNQTIVGESLNARIVSNSTTADVFTVGDGAVEIQNLQYSNFSIWANVVKTAGYAFNCSLISRSKWSNVFLSRPEDPNQLFDGIYLDRFDQCSIEGGAVRVLNDGVKCRGDSGGTFGAELTLYGGFRIIGGRYGLHIGGATGGVHVEQGDIIEQSSHGILISDTLQAGVTNREIFLGSTLSCDSTGGSGIRIESNGVVHLMIDGTWTASHNVSGIDIQPNQNESFRLSANGVRVFNNGSHGIVVNDGEALIDNCLVLDNGQGGSGGHGIYIVSSTASPFCISNCYCISNGNATVGYGIDIAGGNDEFVVTGNILKGNGQGQLRNNSGNSQVKIVRDNVGYSTQNSGSTSVLSGTNSVTVDHGLDELPGNILITPFDSNQGADFYVINVTTTQFTINLGATASINRNFYWRASIPFGG